jgi:hypothetical protein
MTRDEVHALLGAPWLASEPLGVEVYRLQGKQHVLMLIVAVPMPVPGDTIEAYSLVVYGQSGKVTATASDVVQAEVGGAGNVVLRAGEFQFAHVGWDTVSMSRDAYLAEASAHGAGASCTVLVTCDPSRLDAVADHGFCNCEAGLTIDGGARRSLRLLSPAILHPGRLSESGCRKTGGHVTGPGTPLPGTCVLNPLALYPVPVPAGSHALRFLPDIGSRGVTGDVNCAAAAQVSYATLGGRFMRCMQIEKPVSDKGAVGETVFVSSQLPPSRAEAWVIVNDNGQWLYP